MSDIIGTMWQSGRNIIQITGIAPNYKYFANQYVGLKKGIEYLEIVIDRELLKGMNKIKDLTTEQGEL